MAAGDGGGGGGGGVEIPQPLIVTLTQYKSKEAVVVELAMRLYQNALFTTPNGSPANVHAVAQDCIVRAQQFVNAAGSLIDEIVEEG